jgi:hypothetical protein
MLYSSPLCPAGNSVPWAWPWKIAKMPTIAIATASFLQDVITGYFRWFLG